MSASWGHMICNVMCDFILLLRCKSVWCEWWTAIMEFMCCCIKGRDCTYALPILLFGIVHSNQVALFYLEELYHDLVCSFSSHSLFDRVTWQEQFGWCSNTDQWIVVDNCCWRNTRPLWIRCGIGTTLSRLTWFCLAEWQITIFLRWKWNPKWSNTRRVAHKVWHGQANHVLHTWATFWF